jgi:Ni,Fe-hydrogenase I small subunit
MTPTFYEVMRQQGITRRSFIKFCSLTAASLGLGSGGAARGRVTCVKHRGTSALLIDRRSLVGR